MGALAQQLALAGLSNSVAAIIESAIGQTGNISVSQLTQALTQAGLDNEAAEVLSARILAVPAGSTRVVGMTDAQAAAAAAAGIVGMPAAVMSEGEVAGVRGLAAGSGNLPLSGYVSTWTKRTALQALALSSSRRIDLVMLGDSNQAYSGYGFSTGIEKALSAKFGIYATGQCNRTTPAHYTYAQLNSDAQFSSTGATPTTLGDLYQPYSNPDAAGNGVKAQYTWVASGTTVSGGNIPGIYATPGWGSLSGALKAWIAWGSSNAMGGQFKHSARLEYSPFTTIASASSAVLNSDTQASLKMSYIDIPPGSRTGNTSVRWMAPNASAPNAVVGPWIGYYMRLEDSSKLNGVSCHTLYASGGQSLWNFAYELQSTSDNSLLTFFSEVRRLQIAAGYSPIVVIYINSGLNDRNNTRTPSRGPSRIYGQGNSSSEYVDNFRAIQRRIYDVWSIAGWPVDELYWLAVPSHRIADPDDSQLSEYRSAMYAATVNDPHTSVIDLGQLMTYASANSSGWYAAGQNQMHLTNAGYDGVSAIIAAQIP